MKCCNIVTPKSAQFVVCVNCLSIYHQSCARRNPEFQVIEETKIKFCQLSKGNHEQGKETLLGVENKYLKELLEEVKNKNKILTLNNDLLLQRIQQLEEGNICQKRKQSDTGVATRPKIVISKHLKRDLGPAPTWKTSQSTSASNVIQELQYLDQHHEDHEGKTDNWRKVTHKKQGRFVVGKNVSSNTICTVPKLVHLYVTRLKPNTEPDELKKMLEPNFPELLCERHNSKHPDLYTSMKVTIKHENLRKAWEGEVWPNGAKWTTRNQEDP
ncbi:hypothetical protein JTB14_022473 [Gonioctena quinquepunctata]|nr:hypothetical protein JTB14_022473 [Gonioctena quinquepunctata]